MAKKKSFILYLDSYTESVGALSFEQKGMLFDAIFNHVGANAEKPELGLLNLAFDNIKATLDRDAKRYEKICIRNSENGKRGGRPKNDAESTPYSTTQKNPKEPKETQSVILGTQCNPEKPDNDNDSGSDIDNDKETTTTKALSDEQPPDDIQKRNESNLPSIETYKTAKKKLLSGVKLERFKTLWEVFDYKKGKANAADSFLEQYSESVWKDMLSGAEATASMREALSRSGRTPKMLQGWLSGRRWEDEQSTDVAVYSGGGSSTSRDTISPEEQAALKKRLDIMGIDPEMDW